MLAGLLSSHGIDHASAVTGEEGWRALAARRPNVALVSIATPGLDGFFRRLRDEYMGALPRLIGIASIPDLTPSVTKLDLDAVVLKPLTSPLLSAVLGLGPPSHAVELDTGRLREMVRLSCLGSDIQASVDGIAQRLGLVYSVNECVLLAVASERQWVGALGEPIPSSQWPDLWLRCDQAVTAGAPLLSARVRTSASGTPTSEVETRLASPIVSPSGAVVGAICLVSASPRLYSVEARDALRDLALRLGAELSWRSIHDRVAGERDRLRESAMLDPMLAIHSRAALEQALQVEIGRFRRTNEPLAVAVIDIAGLREINDRFGHLIGDGALRHVADTARRLVRAQDVVGRYGGDEIAVLLPSTEAEGARRFIDRLRSAISDEPFKTSEGVEVRLGLTIGVSQHTGDDQDGASLLARCAASAYSARKRGETVGVAAPGTTTEPRPSAPQDRFEAGATLAGMYEIVHEISRGAMGVVYRAIDLGLSRPVAIKMLRPDLVNDKDLVQRFRQEAGILAALNHDHLVRVYAFVVDKEDVFFVMELVEGLSLDGVIHEFLDSEMFLPASRVHSIISQVAGALDAMHDAGVMHRDVKPGNIVLDRARDRAVLVDVGLAQRFGQQSDSGGTPGFIAPESFRGGPETPATDVYGLAATTYTLLVGRSPFGNSEDYREILRRQLDERPALPSSYRPDLPADLDLVLLRGLAIEHRDRYSTAGEFARELGIALQSMPDPGRAPRLDEVVDFTESATELPIPDAPEPAAADERGGRPRTLVLDLELVPPAAPHKPIAMTRGIIFRGAARVLGLSATNSWARSIARSNAALADALSLTTSPMAWLPAELFAAMLAAVGASGRNTETFAKELGATVVAQTFRRFYPSSPDTLSPGMTLSAIGALWRKYHSWGTIEIARSTTGYAVLHSTGQPGDVPADPGCCAFAEGWLGQVVAMSGGAHVKVNHPECTGRGDTRCEFAVRWRPAGAIHDPG